MSSKKILYIGAFVGSVVGGYLPALWGGETFSFTGVLLSGIGGILGIIVAYKLSTS